MRRLLFANIKAYRKIGFQVLICISLLCCSMNVLQFILFKIQASILTNNVSLYGEQHAVLFNMTMEKQNSLGNWMGALDEIGYITSLEQPIKINEQSICIGSFDNRAWEMGKLQIIEGRNIERPNHILLEEKIRRQFFPDLKIGDTLSLPICTSLFNGNDLILAGVVRNYSSIWEEVYYKWPPTSCLFPSIILNGDIISKYPTTMNALVKFQPQAANRILQDNNAFLKELGVQWARNEKTYSEQWDEDQQNEIQLIIKTLPILTAICMGACVVYLCIVMMKAHSYQLHSLIDLGISIGTITKLYFIEYFYWLISSLIIGFLAGLTISTLLGIVTLQISLAESISSTVESLQTLFYQNLLNALWFSIISIASIFIYQSRSWQKDHKPKLSLSHHKNVYVPIIVLLAWRLFKKNLRSYISSILCIGVGISIFLYTSSMVRENVDSALPNVPDYVVSVLSNSDVVPYGESAKIPVHVGKYRSIEKDFVHTLNQLDSVENIVSYHTSYDWILIIPNEYIEDGQKWMYYDMEPHYPNDVYTHRRTFINHFTTERDLINKSRDKYIGEYQAIKELGSIGLDWENNVITTCLLQESDSLVWDGKTDLIPCTMEIAKSHSKFIVDPGSIIDGVYFQYLGDLDAFSTTTVLGKADNSNIHKVNAKFIIQKTFISEKEDTPIILHLPHEMFRKYDQAGKQKIEIYVKKNQNVDEVDRLAISYKEEKSDTLYIENRVEQALQRQSLREKLLTTVSIVNALLSISGVFQLYFCFAAHIKSRRKQLQLYYELGFGSTELFLIKYSDLAFSGLSGILIGVAILLILR